MKSHRHLFLAAAALLALLGSCRPSAGGSEPTAAQRLAEIRTLYDAGSYQAALDSIRMLREKCPKAVAERRQALGLWQQASEKLAQEDLATTDSLLQDATARMNAESRILQRNMLGVRRDSLQARYEALIGQIRIIRQRMKEYE